LKTGEFGNGGKLESTRICRTLCPHPDGRRSDGVRARIMG